MNRNHPTFKINQFRRNNSSSRRIQGHDNHQYGKISGTNGSYMLKKNNRALAAELNAYKLQAKALTDKINTLNEENMDLRVELAEIKQTIRLSNDDEHIGNHSIGTQGKNSTDPTLPIGEDELQKRMAKLLEPLKACLHQSLNHTVRLSDSLSQSLELATIPGIRAKSLSSLESSPAELELTRDGVPQTYEVRKNKERNNLSLPTAPFTAKFSKNRPVGPSGATAKVTPMVKGHMVHTKPRLQIAKLNMNDLGEIDDSLSIRQSDHSINSLNSHRNTENADNSIDIDHVESHTEYHIDHDIMQHEENIMPINGSSQNSNQGAVGSTNSVISLNGIRNRRQKKQKYSIRRSQVLHEEDEEILEANASINNPSGIGISMEVNGEPRENETVVLLPRIVLDRVTITSPSKKSNNQNNSNVKRKQSKRRSSIINNMNIANENGSPSSPSTSYQKRHSGSISKKRRSNLSNRYSISNDQTESNRVPTARVVVPSLSMSPSVVLERCQNTISPKQKVAKPNNPTIERTTPNEIQHEDRGSKNPSHQHLISDTPTSRNSFEEFQREMFDMNPLEGPSWLFSDSDETLNNSSREVNKDNVYNSERAKDSYKEENAMGNVNNIPEESGVRGKEIKKWNFNKKERSNAMSMKARLSDRLSKRLSQDFTPNDDVPKPLDDELSENAVDVKEHENNSQTEDSRPEKELKASVDSQSSIKSHNTTEPIDSDSNNSSNSNDTKLRATRSEGMNPEEGKNLNEESNTNIKNETDVLPRPKRRAASAAVGSLKEQPIGKKLRQGDPNTSSIYSSSAAKDEIPNEKSELGSKTQRKSSTGKTMNKKTKK